MRLAILITFLSVMLKLYCSLISFQADLSNFWPMNNLSDIIGGANLYEGFSYSYAPDRFCLPNEAIYFDSGYLQVPQGIYFSDDFTFTVWIYLK